MPSSPSTTSLDPHDLLERAQECEQALGRHRERERRWGPRTIDIDLLAYDDLVLIDHDLILPHPHMLERAFVLVPLAEIAPDRLIAGMKVLDALARVDSSGIEKLAATVSRRPLPRPVDCRKSSVGRHARPWHFAAMTDPENLPLAADFPPATREQWRKLVDAVLKGAPFERLVGKTYDGLAIEPLAARRPDARPIAGRPGAAPWDDAGTDRSSRSGARQRDCAARAQ